MKEDFIENRQEFYLRLAASLFGHGEQTIGPYRFFGNQDVPTKRRGVFCRRDQGQSFLRQFLEHVFIVPIPIIGHLSDAGYVPQIQGNQDVLTGLVHAGGFGLNNRERPGRLNTPQKKKRGQDS